MNHLPIDLTIDYEDQEERKNIRFIKLGCALSHTIGGYLPAFLEAIQSGPVLERKNVVEFIKLMTTLQYFDFRSEFAQKIFEALIKYSYSGSGEEFEIVTFMLTNEEIQERYLSMLVECLGNNSDGEVNFSLCLLERLMFNTLNILQGKKKGPPISYSSISNLLKISFNLAKTRRLHFLNSVDHCNFLRICSYSLQIMRKYASADKNHLKTYENIWKSEISIFQHVDIEVTNCVFGILIELCNFKQVQILEEMEKKPHFEYIVNSSSYLILKCEKINDFWHTFLSKRENSALDLQNFDQLSVITLLTENLYTDSHSMAEIVQKLKIADNLVLVTNLMTKVNHLKRIQLREANHLDFNPEKQINLLQLIQVSFKALYNPIFKVQQDGIFFRVLQEIKVIAAKLEENFENKAEDYIGLLNLLPPLKIIIRKCKNFLAFEDYLETLIKFLLVFLNDDRESKCFENFIVLICEQLNSEINSANHLPNERIKNCHIRVHKMVVNCLKFMRSEAKRIKNMGSYVKCVENLIKINRNSAFKESFSYLQKLVDIIEARSNKFDQQMHSFMSRLIRQSQNEGLGKMQCFQKLYSLTVEQKRVFYLELLFDFAETHYKDTNIISRMTAKNGEIAKICLFSPTSEYSQLRNLSYIITSQSINKQIESSETVLKSLHEIVANSIYRSKLYEQIIELVVKQRNSLSKNFKSQQIRCQLLINFVALMLQMIDIVNDCMEENNQCKLEKTVIFQRIAQEILKFAYMISNCKESRSRQLQRVQFIVDKLKKCIEHNRLKNFPKMQKFFKTLITSYVFLETQLCGSSLKTIEERTTQIQKILKFISLESKEKVQRQTQEENLLSMGFARKLFDLFGPAHDPRLYERGKSTV